MSKIRFVNKLRISQGHDGVFRVRSPEKPPVVLKEAKTFEIAYRWAHKCRRFTTKEPPWADYELEYLSENYGRLPAEEIAEHLGRSINSLKIITFRKLGINQKSNFYTSRAVAKELGLSDAKIVVAWHNHGYLNGSRAPLYNGANRVWLFDYEDIVKCITDRPWLLNIKKMPMSYFRSIVKAEYEKNPWYTRLEAAHFLGLVTVGPIAVFIKNGWLPAVRRPGAGGLGQWIIRHSDLSNFQVNDPRPDHRKSLTLVGTLDHQMEVALKKALNALRRERWYQFGHWASLWTQLNSINKRVPSPFRDYIHYEKLNKEKS